MALNCKPRQSIPWNTPAQLRALIDFRADTENETTHTVRESAGGNTNFMSLGRSMLNTFYHE